MQGVIRPAASCGCRYDCPVRGKNAGYKPDCDLVGSSRMANNDKKDSIGQTAEADKLPSARGVEAQAAAMHRHVIEQVAPPNILVDEGQRVVHLSDNAGRYLTPPGGPLSWDVSDLARPELRFELRSALNRAFAQNASTVSRPIRVVFNGTPRLVHLVVKPSKNDGHPRQAVVMFIEGEATNLSELKSDREALEDMVRRLTLELELARLDLQTMSEESAAANQELRANNKELQFVSEQLRLKLDVISRAHSDLQNLMAVTDFGTLFLDASLRIKRFTDRVTRLFSITPADEGRPITDFAHQLKYTDLIKDARTVLADLAPIRREVQSDADRWFEVCLRPYRSVDGKIDGVVITYVDITERKRVEQHQQLLVAELDHRVKNILAQVAVVAAVTSQGSRTIGAFLRSLEGRIQSMAATHMLLSKSGWQSVGLDSVVRNELAPYATDTNVTISGTDVMLGAAEVQAVAKVLHELVTNAAKYGALSIPGGQVSVRWDRKAHREGINLALIWQELSGPPVCPEVQSSYGSSLIRNLIPHELGGKVDLVFAPEGVSCRIELPIKPSSNG